MAYVSVLFIQDLHNIYCPFVAPDKKYKIHILI
nr:MAG TPA: hypothetical protein [Caudoviricetes sp.]